MTTIFYFLSEKVDLFNAGGGSTPPPLIGDLRICPLKSFLRPPKAIGFLEYGNLLGKLISFDDLK